MQNKQQRYMNHQDC